MIVALSFGDMSGDSPSVFVVDSTKLTPEWRANLEWQHSFETTWKHNLLRVTRKQPPLPDEWESLEKAQVPLPATVEYALHLYYE